MAPTPEKTKSKRADSRPGRPARRSPIKRSHPASGSASSVTPAQMLVALRGERDKIDVAIAAIEALA